jgi:hypothetical protein
MLLEYADFIGFKMMSLDNHQQTCNVREFKLPSGYKSQAFTRMCFHESNNNREISMMMPASLDFRGETHYFDSLWYNNGPLSRHDLTLESTYKIDIDPNELGGDILFDILFGMKNYEGKWKLEFGGWAIGGLGFQSLPLRNFGNGSNKAYMRIVFENAENAVIYKLTS